MNRKELVIFLIVWVVFVLLATLALMKSIQAEPVPSRYIHWNMMIVEIQKFFGQDGSSNRLYFNLIQVQRFLKNHPDGSVVSVDASQALNQAIEETELIQKQWKQVHKRLKQIRDDINRGH